MRTTILIALAFVLLSACGGAGPTGSLQVNIDGLPAGLDAAVTVQGAGGYVRTVTTTTTLTGLAPGLYSVTATSVRTDDEVVSMAYDVSSAPPATVEVVDNETATANTDYSKRAGTGRL